MARVLNFTHPLSSSPICRLKQLHNAIGRLKGTGHASSSGRIQKSLVPQMQLANATYLG
jgi:hypothetical protein